jgi:hypothetical protein
MAVYFELHTNEPKTFDFQAPSPEASIRILLMREDEKGQPLLCAPCDCVEELDLRIDYLQREVESLRKRGKRFFARKAAEEAEYWRTVHKKT